MIRHLAVTGFKRLSSCSLEFKPLTVLTGRNGAGKSSLIQALLLARQASTPGTSSVPLNGPFGMELGSVQDVLNLPADAEEPIVRLLATMSDGAVVSLSLDAQDEGRLHLPVVHREPDHPPAPLGGSNSSFAYLCAERLGPREVLGASARPVDDLDVGVRGEFCAQVLDVHGLAENFKVQIKRRHPSHLDDVDAFLKYQVEAWLSDIARRTEVQTVRFPNTTVTAIRFRVPGAEWVRAPNMGFGVSYALPVILAGLFVPSGGMLIVENPEAHLHPAGQSRIGTFLATLAADGLQVVAETHSDHVLNGIRRAIGEHKVLEADQALVHFFEDDGGPAQAPNIHALDFTPAGSLSQWPPRFFDQYQLDVAALSRVHRGRGAR